MLVHAKNPKTLLKIESHNIYGREVGPVTEVPFDLYERYKDCLEGGTYREHYLSKKLGRPCSTIAFTYEEIRYLPNTTLLTLCELFDIEFNPLNPKSAVQKIKSRIKCL